MSTHLPRTAHRPGACRASAESGQVCARVCVPGCSLLKRKKSFVVVSAEPVLYEMAQNLTASEQRAELLAQQAAAEAA